MHCFTAECQMNFRYFFGGYFDNDLKIMNVLHTALNYFCLCSIYVNQCRFPQDLSFETPQ